MQFKTPFYHLNMKACFAPLDHKARLTIPFSQSFHQSVDGAVKQLKQDYNQGKLAFANICQTHDDIPELQVWAEHFQQFDQVLILGTGGSSLGGQALQEMRNRKSHKSQVKLNIITNIDPYIYDRMMMNINWLKTGVIVISKSGETAETLMQFLIVHPMMQKILTPEQLREHILLIAEPGDNSLRRIGKEYQYPVLDHPSDLGGRYSVLSLVGILPALIAGLDPYALRNGAKSIFDDFMLCQDWQQNGASFAAATLLKLEQEKSITSQVMLSYSDRLGSLARWHRQLWAESLGKQGHGTTPIYGSGPVDQHSQLQLWLDGPSDKVYTILGAPLEVSPHHVTPEQVKNLPNLDYLKHRSMGELMEYSRQATLQTLIDHDRPLRSLTLQVMDEQTIGALMMHFMLETVISAYIMGINPYDQPAVEHGKQLIRHYLNDLNRPHK